MQPRFFYNYEIEEQINIIFYKIQKLKKVERKLGCVCFSK